ncbi:hypothetical protein KJ909_03025 [Patescibacteria group bacterium]|nr:hypothetical protein [Patescibacteria group bacterium]
MDLVKKDRSLPAIWLMVGEVLKIKPVEGRGRNQKHCKRSQIWVKKGLFLRL